MKIGLCVDALELPLRRALPVAAQLGGPQLQLTGWGELHPDALTATGRREVRNLLRSFNMESCAIACALRRGIEVPADQQPRLEYIQKVMALAFELGARLIVLPCPKFPQKDAEVDPELHEAIDALGAAGDRLGVRVALEIGFDDAGVVVAFLDRYAHGSLAVTFDPANLMLHGHDPANQIPTLGGRVAHVHARDALRNTVNGTGAETALGAGDVPWLSILPQLMVREYQGAICIEREPNHAGELPAAIAFLKKFVLPEKIQTRPWA
jgi:L-ribulose-5-phosphate 3-epimerase